MKKCKVCGNSCDRASLLCAPCTLHAEAVMAKAQNVMNNAVISGKIRREPCFICGNEKSEGHHEDYTQPLYILWMCKSHHRKRHGFMPDVRLTTARKLHEIEGDDYKRLCDEAFSKHKRFLSNFGLTPQE